MDAAVFSQLHRENRYTEVPIVTVVSCGHTPRLGFTPQEMITHLAWVVVILLAVLLGVAFALLSIKSKAARSRKRDFLRRVGPSYGYVQQQCGFIDKWRASEFPALAAPLCWWPRRNGGLHYLDYAGAALPSASQLDLMRLDDSKVLGNPHSLTSSDDTARRLVREKFRLDDECAVIWTSGATDGLRLVASYWLRRGRKLAYHVDSHTSCVGTRRIAIEVGAEVVCVSSDWSEVEHCLDGLAIVTLESNFHGKKYEAAASVLKSKGWTVCLDAAKAASTAPFDLGVADFAVVSFYKLFGAPTGLGALFARREAALELLSRKRESGYFGGGTVERVSASVVDWCVVKSNVEEAFADGTPHFVGLAHLQRGFEELQRVGGLVAIERHAGVLGDELERRLRQLAGVCRVYERRQGCSIVIFNMLRDDGTIVSPATVASYLLGRDLRLRSGCLCNAGACARTIGISHSDWVKAWERGAACGTADDLTADGRPLGVLRASFGKDSLWEDLDALVETLRTDFATVAAEDSSPNEEKDDLAADTEARTTTYRLDELNVYPVKGCRPMRPSQWPLEASGRLRHDREWAVVDDRLGVVVTAKTHAHIALVDASVDDTSLRLTFKQDTLVLAVEEEQPTEFSMVRICGSERRCVQTARATISTFFSRALVGSDDQCRFRLVRSKSESLANSAPLLLVTRAAVATLNAELLARAERPVTADHFRPNVVVSELTPSVAKHPEDKWTSLKTAGCTFEVLGPCDRCAAVDVDPETASKRPSTLKVLTAYRLRHRRAKVTFGIFLGLAQTPNRVSSSDTPIILSRGDVVHPQR